MTFDMLGDLVIWKKKIFLSPGDLNDTDLTVLVVDFFLAKSKVLVWAWVMNSAPISTSTKRILSMSEGLERR